MGNIIHTGFLENPTEISIFPVRKSFLPWKILFCDVIIIFKGKYLTSEVRHNETIVVIYTH